MKISQRIGSSWESVPLKSKTTARARHRPERLSPCRRRPGPRARGRRPPRGLEPADRAGARSRGGDGGRARSRARRLRSRGRRRGASSPRSSRICSAGSSSSSTSLLLAAAYRGRSSRSSTRSARACPRPRPRRGRRGSRDRHRLRAQAAGVCLVAPASSGARLRRAADPARRRLRARDRRLHRRLHARRQLGDRRYAAPFVYLELVDAPRPPWATGRSSPRCGAPLCGRAQLLVGRRRPAHPDAVRARPLRARPRAGAASVAAVGRRASSSRRRSAPLVLKEPVGPRGGSEPSSWRAV